MTPRTVTLLKRGERSMGSAIELSKLAQGTGRYATPIDRTIARLASVCGLTGLGTLNPEIVRDAARFAARNRPRALALDEASAAAACGRERREVRLAARFVRRTATAGSRGPKAGALAAERSALVR